MEDKSIKLSHTLYVLIPLFMLSWVFLWYAIQAKPSENSDENKKEAEVTIEPWVVLVGGSSKAVKNLAETIFDSSNPLAKRAQAIKSLALLEDPAVITVLVAVYRGEAGFELSAVAKEELVNRINMAGFPISARYVGNILNSNQVVDGKIVDPRLSFVIGVIDYSAPFEKRKTDLIELATSDSEIAIQLAAILSYEGSAKDKDLFRLMLTRLLGLTDESSKKPLISIILSQPSLWPLFESEFIENLSGLSTPDLLIGFERLAGGSNRVVQAFASELKKRNYFGRVDLVFIDELLNINPNSTPRNIAVALSHGALQKINKEDIASFANWQSINVIRPLLAICLTETNPDLAMEAFDSLVARSSYSDFLMDLFGLVRSGHWKDREKFIRPIGILGMLDLASDQDLDEALNAFSPLLSSGAMLKLMLKSNDSRLIVKVLDKTGIVASSDILLELLEHIDKTVRISAVKGLAGRNDLSIKHQIQKHYRNEQDVDVRNALEASHPWLIDNH